MKLGKLDAKLPWMLTLTGVWLSSIPAASPGAADPDFTPTENQYLSSLFDAPLFAQPGLIPGRLVNRGWQACTDIGNGVSPNVEKDKLDMALMNEGVNAARAAIGTLIHFALRDLCPGTQNTTGI